MNRTIALATVAGLALLTAWLHREHARGTFDSVERGFIAWLAANTAGQKKSAQLTPLTLVLYDDEASELAGTTRLALLDGTLFARAASRLGALAAGVEGIGENPSRMVEAAEGMPVFGGYDWQAPPGQGWTPAVGAPPATWPEVPGVAGRVGRFARGFIAPPEGTSSVRTVLLAARNGDRSVPSFLALAWTVANRSRWSDLKVESDALVAGNARIVLGQDGAAKFLPTGEPKVMTMNELLVASEKFEREGGRSPFRDHIMVLARATADVARVAVGEMRAATPAERLASAWEALRTNRLFLAPAWWYPFVVVLVAVFLTFGPARRSNAAALTAALFSLLVFALVALGVFGSARVLLPATPTLLTLGAALVLGRAGHRAGWFGK